MNVLASSGLVYSVDWVDSVQVKVGLSYFVKTLWRIKDELQSSSSRFTEAQGSAAPFSVVDRHGNRAISWGKSWANHHRQGT